MRTPAGKTQRFAWIHLENWRNFARVEVDLQRRVFLVGPNASGKSNFLDVFRFLHDIVSVGGGFQEAVRRRGGVSSLRCLAARRYPDIVIRTRIGGDEGDSAWTYELHFTQDNRQRPLVKREQVSREQEVLLRRPNEEDEKDPERLTQTYLEQVNVNQAFREIAEFFAAVRYRHIVPQLIREPDRSVGRANDPFGGDFLEQIARTPEKTRNARLRRIRDALRVAVPQLQDLELQRDARGTPTCAANTNTGDPRAHGRRKISSPMERCGFWASSGRFKMERGRCYSRSRNCRSTPMSSGTFLRCWPARSVVRAARYWSARTLPISCATRASVSTRSSCCSRDRRAPLFDWRLNSRRSGRSSKVA
jgi:hypothetical protein